VIDGTEFGDGLGADASGFDDAGGFPVLGIPKGFLSS